MTKITEAHIHEALDAAKDNGYFDIGESLAEMTDLEIACDMVMFDDDLAGEDADPEEIEPFVKTWRAKQ